MAKDFISTIPMPAGAVAAERVLGCNLFMIAKIKRLSQIGATSLFFSCNRIGKSFYIKNYKNHFSLWIVHGANENPLIIPKDFRRPQGIC